MNTHEQLLGQFQRDALLRGRFVLASGRTSAYYIDARQVTLSGMGSLLIGQIVFEMVRRDSPDAVAGMSLGADPIVTAVTVVSASANQPLLGLLVRKQAKDHGTGRRVEGPLRRGMSAVVLEDTSTTGASALEAAEALGDEGVSVTRVISLIDREEGAADAIRASGLRFDAVFTLTDILEAVAAHPRSDLESGASPGSPAIAAYPQTAAVGSGSGGDTPKRASLDGVKSGRKLTIQTDGASQGNPGAAGAGWIIVDEHGTEINRGSRNLGKATSNVAEYQALILGLTAAKAEGATDLTVRMDSELVVKQMRGQYRVKHPGLEPLFRQAKEAAAAFPDIRFESVPRERNQIADRLATSAAARGTRDGDGPKC